MECRLAAILSIEVVGYSYLMEVDEADTFERLRTLRKQLLKPETVCAKVQAQNGTAPSVDLRDRSQGHHAASRTRYHRCPSH